MGQKLMTTLIETRVLLDVAAARLARAHLFTIDPKFAVYPVRIIAPR